ncbi:MAG: hypothetical protein P8I55_05750 [Crocinitomix sp.]|nr:hypothetical protein [Crocinitomix sp.]
MADRFSGSAQGDIYKLSADYSNLEVIVPDVYTVNGIAFDQNDNLYFSKGGSVATDGYTLEYIYVLLAGETTPIEFAGNSFHGIPSYQWNAG